MMEACRADPDASFNPAENIMNNIVYIVGLVVVVGAIIAFVF